MGHHETARVQLLPVGRRNRKFYTMLNSHPAELWNWPLQPHKQIKEVLIKIASVSLQQEVITLQFFQSYLSSENISEKSYLRLTAGWRFQDLQFRTQHCLGRCEN